MDIGSGSAYPAGALSNFSPHPFEFDGIQCASMEGLLQSFKFFGFDMQIHVCTLVGKAAKFKGKDKNWKTTQKLHWNGVVFDRSSARYQELLDRAFDALATNDGFQRALLATGDATLTHSIGKRNESETVLTEREFCSRLMKIRSKLKLAMKG